MPMGMVMVDVRMMSLMLGVRGLTLGLIRADIVYHWIGAESSHLGGNLLIHEGESLLEMWKRITLRYLYLRVLRVLRGKRLRLQRRCW